MRRVAVAGLLAVALAACQASPSITSSDPRVSVGALSSCAELGLSDLRCTFLKLRAAREAGEVRPGDRPVSSAVHAPGPAPDGQSPIPSSQVVVVVVVFTFADGSGLGVPLLCPRNPSGQDPACNPQVE